MACYQQRTSFFILKTWPHKSGSVLRGLKKLTLLSSLMGGFSYAELSAELSAQLTAPPPGAQVTDVRLRGTGCDMKNTRLVLSPDNSDLSILFDDYGVEIGMGTDQPQALQRTKDCHIQVQMMVPSGWQMAFRAADYRGFVNLSSQGTAFHRLSIMQEGAPIVSLREASLRGPLNKDYYVRSEVRPERITWSKCLGGLTMVNLVSQLGVALNPRSSDRSLTQIMLDSADTSFRQNLSISWRRCAGGVRGFTNRPKGVAVFSLGDLEDDEHRLRREE
jgi:hypothetical protein